MFNYLPAAESSFSDRRVKVAAFVYNKHSDVTLWHMEIPALVPYQTEQTRAVNV